MKNKLNLLKDFAEKELYQNILPFWREKAIDLKNGGFYGEISSDLLVKEDAPKGLILNARILWTFSAAYQISNNLEDKNLADRAFTYLYDNFYDKENGGYYWSLNSLGEPIDTKKQIYAQAFAMYGFSEYYKITKNVGVLELAKDIFKLIETHAFDNTYNGYVEAFSCNWSDMDDIRLSAKDMNEKKSMNTHLHIVEAYANLYSVWKDDFLAQQLKNLVHLFLEKIISKEDNHLNLFFDDEWNIKSTAVSFGHDIEAGWLVHESALIHGEEQLIDKVRERLVPITNAALEGLSPMGGILHESDRAGKHNDNEYEWWPQAEALVGLLDTYEVSNNSAYIDDALKVIDFINKYIIDKENGEWHFRVSPDGNAINSHEKAGFWKCPYHNGRACIEIIKRVNLLN